MKGDTQGYITVSDVGRMATGSSRSEFPLELVYQHINPKENKRLCYIRASDPCNFWSKAFDVVLFSLQDLLGDKHWEISILNVHLLDLSVEPF